MVHRDNGVSLIEILIGILIVVIASIGTLTYFSSAFGSVNKQGNRRAALERARERLEQLMAAADTGLPAEDGQLWWCTTGNPCTDWQASATPIAQTIAVDDMTGLRMETSAQFIDDPSAGTTTTLDTWVFGTKVWFTGNTGTDNNFNRVYIRTLKTP